MTHTFHVSCEEETMSLVFARPSVCICLLLVLVLEAGFAGRAAEAQMWKRLTQVAACGAGGFAGVKLGEKIAEFEAKRRNLSPADAAKHKKAFQIGMGLALCGGGAAIAGSTYSKLSKRGMQAREKEINAALADASPTPRTYADPETPSLQGIVTAQPAVLEGDQECRIIQDHLGEDEALVKYCKSPNGAWAVKTM